MTDIRRYDIAVDEFMMCDETLARAADEAFDAWFATTGLKNRRQIYGGVSELGDRDLHAAAVAAALTERADYRPRPDDIAPEAFNGMPVGSYSKVRP